MPFVTGVAGQLVFHSHPAIARYLHEVFFVTNYERGIWDHTWTLAVEEHFYIFLPIFLLVLSRLSSNREDPFRLIPWQPASLQCCACSSERTRSILGLQISIWLTLHLMVAWIGAVLWGLLLPVSFSADDT